MGGFAFTSHGKSLFTPRMPKAVYEHVKSRCHNILRGHYICVASPIDGPAKTDFGDIDVLVAWPKVNSHVYGHDQIQAIAKLLGATDIVLHGSACASNLAIPWPEELDAASSDDDDDVDGAQQHKKKKHIQVDVRICQTLQNLEWILLKHAHGDIWSLLGSIIRPYGLTVDDQALWIRVPEVEEFNKRKSKVFLTSDPSEVIDFLGLPITNAWDEPFASLEDMYEYVAQCPMFWVCPKDMSGDDDESHVARDSAKETGAPRDVQRLTYDERKRRMKRPAYTKWLEDYIPECRRQGRFLQKRTSREQVMQAARSRFHIGPEYDLRRHEALVERQREIISRDLIKGTIPPSSHSDAQATLFRGCLVKALKKIILDGDTTTYGVKTESGFRNEDGFFDLDRTARFIAEHKDEVGKAAMLLHHTRARQRLVLQAEEGVRRAGKAKKKETKMNE
ncbi:hypothetical protein E4U21_002887 [Claviceps maximensis]|nr:hypothetical protein E4U21_002887 [Claviceps maximensis]